MARFRLCILDFPDERSAGTFEIRVCQQLDLYAVSDL